MYQRGAGAARPPRAPGGVLLLLLLAIAGAYAAGCAPADPAAATVRQIIDELAVQRFGTATARYRQYEDIVLSPAAAAAWRRGLEHEDATVREWSVDSLARIGLPEDVPRVVAALDDSFRNVQEAAARSIIDLAPEVAVTTFIERLAAPEPLRQMIAAQGLAALGDSAGVQPLIDRFADGGTEDGVRRVIAQSLAALADARAVAPLAEVAGSEQAAPGLRRDAAEALATFDTAEATRALRALLGSNDAYVQEVARRAIAARR